jgi:hypothetical protein
MRLASGEREGNESLNTQKMHFIILITQCSCVWPVFGKHLVWISVRYWLFPQFSWFHHVLASKFLEIHCSYFLHFLFHYTVKISMINSLSTTPWRHMREFGNIPPFLTSPLGEVSGQLHSTGRFTPWETDPDGLYIRGWAGLSAVLEVWRRQNLCPWR